jgi:hypothetical protein
MTKEATETVFLRLPPALVAALRAKAKDEGRSMNKQAERMLAKALKMKVGALAQMEVAK